MKKFIFAILFSIGVLCVNAQYYEILTIEQIENNIPNVSLYCAEDDNLLGLIIYGTGCSDQVWMLKDGKGNVLVYEENVDSLIIYNLHEGQYLNFFYEGCNGTITIRNYEIIFNQFVPNPFSEPVVWKRPNESVILSTLYGYVGVWSTGETSESIEVSEPGTYSITLTNVCGPVTYSVEVRDNVELYRATCDLVTNKNKITWNTTPEQSEYITSVKVYRNDNHVGTVPYMDGTFTDNIGSEDTQWQYHIVGVSVEGDDCSIPSYWKRTIHLDCVENAQGNMILQWTPYAEESPSKNEVAAYGIYDVVNGIPYHVIDVGYFTDVYVYNPADFHGYGAVAAVFTEDGLKRSEELEDLAFSNHTKQMLGIEDIVKNSIRVYPNPSHGTFTIEGAKNLTIYNILGQTITTSYDEDEIHTFTLTPGLYFVKSGEGMTKKVVVQ